MAQLFVLSTKNI